MNVHPRLLVAAAERTALSGAGLDSFAALWAVATAPVEAGNRARGGESAVGILELSAPEGPRRYYLKRQRNFNCRTLRHCWRGIPLAQREWQAIQALQARGIATLEVAAFGRERRGGEDRALLLTRALDDHQDLDAWLAAHPEAEFRQHLAAAVGALLAALHRSGWRHGCLYPKHLFVARDFAAGAGPAALRLIDLEKCKRIRRRWGGLRDLDTLLRHCPALDAPLRERILAAYGAGLGLEVTPGALARRVERSRR
ncbi:MAG: lipopolysaccharide kinase InaA family protein [Pseudomonadota bacterium]|jgi:hypothetical protein